MKPKMSAAQLEARRTAGLSIANPTHACSGALRTPDETAKRSVIRISDPQSFIRRKMELDPETQLEKRSFAARAKWSQLRLKSGRSMSMLRAK